MIKIQKRTYNIPSCLSSPDAATSLTSINAKALNGTLTSKDFEHDIYGNQVVKDALKEDQHNKCAYCECSLCGNFSPVEHYRPKTQYQQHKKSPRSLGYHWLAYDWKNLLCSCDVCNGANYKGNLFPLRYPAARDIANKNISNEVPLIINPAEEDPGNHIRFNKYMAIPLSHDGQKSAKGAVTIKVFNLNGRKDLLEDRKNQWKKAMAFLELCHKTKMSLEDSIEETLKVFGEDKDIYAGMFRHQQLWPTYIP